MTKQKSALRVDVYPDDWADDGTLMFRFRVVDAKHVPFATSSKTYARPSSAWRAAARLSLDPVDSPSAIVPKAKRVTSVKRR